METEAQDKLVISAEPVSVWGTNIVAQGGATQARSPTSQKHMAAPAASCLGRGVAGGRDVQVGTVCDVMM